ncbi:unnamed protein product [Urochloa humidicola]
MEAAAAKAARVARSSLAAAAPWRAVNGGVFVFIAALVAGALVSASWMSAGARVTPITPIATPTTAHNANMDIPLVLVATRVIQAVGVLGCIKIRKSEGIRGARSCKLSLVYWGGRTGISTCSILKTASSRHCQPPIPQLQSVLGVLASSYSLDGNGSGGGDTTFKVTAPAAWRPQSTTGEAAVAFPSPPMPVVTAGKEIPSPWNQGFGGSGEAARFGEVVWDLLRVEHDSVLSLGKSTASPGSSESSKNAAGSSLDCLEISAAGKGFTTAKGRVKDGAERKESGNRRGTGAAERSMKQYCELKANGLEPKYIFEPPVGLAFDLEAEAIDFYNLSFLGGWIWH